MVLTLSVQKTVMVLFSETTVRDGKSPTAKVVDNGDGTHTITVVNSDGTTTTTTVRDGKEPKLEVY